VRELVRRLGGTVSLTDADPGLRVEILIPAQTPNGAGRFLGGEA
jgi:hypothetical protein